MHNSAGNTYQWSEEVILGASFDFKISYSVGGKAAIDTNNSLEDRTNCFVKVVEEPLFPCSLDWISIKVDNKEIDDTSFIIKQGIVEFFLLPLDFLAASNLFVLIDGFYVHSNTTLDTFLEIKSSADSGVLHSFFFSQSSDNGTIILKIEQTSDEASFPLPSLALLSGFAIYSVIKRRRQKF
jgi:hypothetical protein